MEFQRVSRGLSNCNTCFKQGCPSPPTSRLLRSRKAVQRGPRWTKRRDAVTTKLNYKITTVQCLNVQRGSFTHYSPIVTPRTLSSIGKATKWDTHHNRNPRLHHNRHCSHHRCAPPPVLAFAATSSWIGSMHSGCGRMCMPIPSTVQNSPLS